MTDYATIVVPKELVPAVVEFIERQDERPDHGPRVPPPDSQGLIHGWDKETLERAYRESKQGLREVFEYLASRPDEEVTFDEVADGIGAEHGVRTVLGRLGGFGKVIEKKYGQKRFPWYYRDESGRGRMEMPAAAAEVIRDVASS